MLKSIVPRDEVFYEAFEKIAQIGHEAASCLLEELCKLEVALYVSFRIDGIKEGQTEEATKIIDMLLKTKEGQAVSEQLQGSLQRGDLEGFKKIARMAHSTGAVADLASKVKSLEHEADDTVHRAMDHLHKTFVTPFDRADIHRLLMRLDNIVDLVDAASSRVNLYKPKTVPEEAKSIARVLVDATEVVVKVVKAMKNVKKNAGEIMKLAVEINRLENVADEARRSGIARLFSEENDFKELMKWREIMEHMEGATDRCEDVSDIIQGIVIENT